MTKIIGNNDGPGGRNETYKIGTRKNVSRTLLEGIPSAHVRKLSQST
jgi:hypothetical protein